MKIINYLIIFCIIFIPGTVFAGELNITAIDFGSKDKQYYGENAIGVPGDSVLLESKGNYLLMDSGNNVSANRVIAYLKEHNVKKLSLYLSHAHNDHYGKLQNIIEDPYFTVDKLYIGDLKWYENYYASMESKYGAKAWFKELKKRYDAVKGLINSAKSHGVTVTYLKKGSSFTIGDATANVLLANFDNTITIEQYCKMDAGYDCRDRNTNCFTLDNCASSKVGHYINNTSLVTMVTIDGRKFLTAGDIEGYRHQDKNSSWSFLNGAVTPEEKLIKMHNNGEINLKSDIFKLSHHGIYTSNMSSVTDPNIVNYVNAPYVFYQNEHDNINEYASWGNTYDTDKGQARWWHNRIVDSESRSNVFSAGYNGSTTFNIKNGTIIATAERNTIPVTVYYKNTYGTTLSTRKFNFNKSAKYHIMNYAPNRSGYTLKSPSTVTNELSGGPTSSGFTKTVTYEATSKYYSQLKFNMNGGKLADKHGNNISTSGQWITLNGNTIVQKIQFGKQTDEYGLYNYNNPDVINIVKTGYKVNSGSEWNTQADGKGKTYNQSSVYQSDNFCSSATANCTTSLYLKWVPISYTISYNLNGGTVSNANPTSYTIESSNIVLNNPTKTGYTFNGWTGSNGTSAQKSVTITKGSYGNKNYIANWNANSYTITFNSNGGSNVSSISAQYGSKITKPADPVKTNYIFGGWYSDSELTNPYTFNTMPAKNITLYAKWIDNGKRNIKYELDGGKNNASNPDSYYIGNEIKLESGTKTGYSFLGWYTDSKYTKKIEKITSDMDEEIVLYAKWKINSYKITFDSNGGSSISPIETNYNDTIKEPSNPTRTGYSFAGWYSNSELTNEYVFNKMPAENITLYAKWTIKKYTITFDSNGGSNISPIESDYNNTITEPNNPTMEGYSFDGWYSDSELTNPYTFNKMPAKNITLYAKWQANTYTITFDSNGGSSISPIESQFDIKITKPDDPVKEGYLFVGWYSDSSLTNIYYFDTMPAENMVLYAKWAVNINTVTFETDGGTIMSPAIVETGDKVTKPSNPVKTGYSFEGWYSDNNYTTLYNFNNPVDKDITLYAKWIKKQYTVIYDTNGGNEISDASVLYDEAVPRPENPTKEGYTFINWQLDNKDYTFSTMPAHNLTLTAKWQANTYTISFESNGGSNIEPISNLCDSSIYEPTDPIKDGYIFAGWYSNPELTNLYTFNKMPAQNITLYAKWVEGTDIIDYELDGGINNSENPTSYITGNEIILKEPTKEGFEFLGWYLDSSYNQKTTKITSNMRGEIKLYAKWKAINYKITFNSNGGSSVSDLVAHYEETIIKPNNPIKEGYRFAGWYSNPELTELFTFDKMPAQNITLYAKWEVILYTITFNSNGGNSINPIIAAENTQITAPNDPYKDGYRFAGWYSNPELTELFTFDKMPHQNITLYAKWVNNDTRKISYELDGGINDLSNPTSYRHGEEIILKPAKKDGYKFIDWYLDKDYKTKIDKISSKMDTDIVLYAKFLKGMEVNVPITSSSSIKIIIGSVLLILSIYKICNLLGINNFQRFKNKK